MNVNKVRKPVMYKDLVAMGTIPWKAWKTVKKKIEEEGFPGYYESGHYYFYVDEVDMWFKRKRVRSAA